MADNKARLAELRDKKTQGQMTDERETQELERLERESGETRQKGEPEDTAKPQA